MIHRLEPPRKTHISSFSVITLVILLLENLFRRNSLFFFFFIREVKNFKHSKFSKTCENSKRSDLARWLLGRYYYYKIGSHRDLSHDLKETEVDRVTPMFQALTWLN